MKRKRPSREALDRIEAARAGLRERGYRCLNSGDFGLPTYDVIEVWSKAGRVLYLVYEREWGGWDILDSIDRSNEIAKIWEAVDRIEFKSKVTP